MKKTIKPRKGKKLSKVVQQSSHGNKPAIILAIAFLAVVGLVVLLFFSDQFVGRAYFIPGELGAGIVNPGIIAPDTPFTLTVQANIDEAETVALRFDLDLPKGLSCTDIDAEALLDWGDEGIIFEEIACVSSSIIFNYATINPHNAETGEIPLLDIYFPGLPAGEYDFSFNEFKIIDLANPKNYLVDGAEEVTVIVAEVYVPVIEPVDGGVLIEACGYEDWVAETTYTIPAGGLEYTGLSGNCLAPTVDDISIKCNSATITATRESGTAIYLQDVENTLIKDCVISDFRTGIATWNTFNTEVDSNTFLNVGDGLNFLETSEGQVLDNVFLESDDGIVFRRDTAGVYVSTNRFTGGSRAIHLEKAESNFIFENTILNPELWGIHVDSATGNDIYENVITNVASSGIYVNARGNTIRDNVISGTMAGAGIFLFDDSGDTTISGNILTNNFQGIKIDLNEGQTDVTINDNKVCGSIKNDFTCTVSMESALGDGNTFGTVISCVDTWPVLDEHYSACEVAECTPGDTTTDRCVQLGTCSGAVATCLADGSWGECNILPQEEFCDGIDTNCNGVNDDGSIERPLAESQLGVCAAHTQTCTDSGWSNNYGLIAEYERLEELTCGDGLDNDCDGTTDDDDADCLDTDADGILDALDNCVADANADQGDSDVDGVGDVCDVEECDGLDNDGDLQIDEGFDVDDDGIGDCLDTDAECDGIDNDADGLVDEGAPLISWYVDKDRDGYGSGVVYQTSCATPTVGYSNNDDDCDDENPVSYPLAPEVCDGLDNDCDDIADERIECPLDTFEDSDGDGVSDSLDLCDAGTEGNVYTDGAAPGCMYGDLNGNSCISPGEVTTLVTSFIANYQEECVDPNTALTQYDGDLDGNGCVDPTDVTQLVVNFMDLYDEECDE